MHEEEWFDILWYFNKVEKSKQLDASLQRIGKISLAEHTIGHWCEHTLQVIHIPSEDTLHSLILFE